MDVLVCLFFHLLKDDLDVSIAGHSEVTHWGAQERLTRRGNMQHAGLLEPTMTLLLDPLVTLLSVLRPELSPTVTFFASNECDTPVF